MLFLRYMFAMEDPAEADPKDVGADKASADDSAAVLSLLASPEWERRLEVAREQRRAALELRDRNKQPTKADLVTPWERRLAASRKNRLHALFAAELAASPDGVTRNLPDDPILKSEGSLSRQGLPQHSLGVRPATVDHETDASTGRASATTSVPLAGATIWPGVKIAGQIALLCLAAFILPRRAETPDPTASIPVIFVPELIASSGEGWLARPPIPKAETVPGFSAIQALSGADQVDFPANVNPPSPDTLTARLGRLGTIGSKLPPLVHLDERLLATLPHIEGVGLMGTEYATGTDLVRFYHPEDTAIAGRAAATVGAKVQDFSAFEPKPAPGTIEIWLNLPES